MVDTLATLQTELRRMTFARRRYLCSELQRRATASQGISFNHLIMWPDVLLYLTPEMVKAAIEATYHASQGDIRRRLEGQA